MPNAQPGLLKSNGRAISNYPVYQLIFGAISMVLASWLRAAMAKTIMVDDHALSGFSALCVFLLFCGGLTIYSIALYQLWQDNRLSLKQIRLLAYGLAVIFSLMLPLLSNDAFSLLLYGDLANHGVDVYRPDHVYQISSFSAYCSAQSATGANVYGPLFTGMLQGVTYFFSNNIFEALVAYKLAALIAALVFIEVGYRTASHIPDSIRIFLFIVLNPIFLIEGLAQLHSDLFAAMFCMSVVFSVTRGRLNLAFLFATLATAVKLNYVLVISFLVIALFIGRKDTSSFLGKLVIAVAIVMVTLIVLYLPYFTSINALVLPFRNLYNQIPSKSIPEVFGDIIFYATQYFTGYTNAGNVMAGDTGIATQKVLVWNNLILICRLAALAAGGVLLYHFLKSGKDNGAWMRTYLRLLLLFLLFYSHVIYPWYLIMILPFVWYEHDQRFMTWLLVLTCFSSAQSIMCAIDRSSSIYILVPPLIMINVIIFMWRFRSNFLQTIK